MLFIVLFQSNAFMNFSSHILSWYQINKRDLPWRHSDDPYHIWLSEIILQQTRINQGLAYYERFINRFPDVGSLAHASEDDVLYLWQGLGYYSRARNLHHTARIVDEEYNGVFPADYNKLLKLKGVGEYTAAAIASISFGLPYAAVDGNVARVLSRYFGISDPPDNPATRKTIKELAAQVLNPLHPGDFNQAMMDLGSLICKPIKPDCQNCPLADQCHAFIDGTTDLIPAPKVKVKIKFRYFHFFLFWLRQKELLFVEKRVDKDIWKNLFQLPLIEADEKGAVKNEQIAVNAPFQSLKDVLMVTPPVPIDKPVVHQLTHQRIEAFFYLVHIDEKQAEMLGNDYQQVKPEEFENMAKPIIIGRFFEKMVPALYAEYK
jgi:A/G-specific adenine glycosylase